MTINNLVSIIVPAYNMEKYISRCLDSLIAQTYYNLEIIVVNDGSTDSTEEIIASYLEKDNRIVYLYQENSGQASARNNALNIFNGNYLMFVDSDDWIELDTVKICLESATQSNADVVIFDYMSVEDTRSIYVKRGLDLVSADSGPCNKFYVREVFDNIRFPEGYWFEDLGIIPAILCMSNNVVKVDRAFYNYYVTRVDSQSNSINTDRIYDVIPMVENCEKLLDNNMKAAYSEQLEYLNIFHILFSVIMCKLSKVDNYQLKVEGTKRVIGYMQEKYPDFLSNKYLKNDKSIRNSIIRTALYFHSKKLHFLGFFIWEVPSRLKSSALLRNI